MNTREIKFRFGYTDGTNWVFQVFNMAQILNAEPFEVTSDMPLMKKYKMTTQDEWTGLKDKNGVQIFEGDILKTISYTTRVIERYKSGFWKGQVKKSENVNVINNVVCEWGKYGFEFRSLNPVNYGINIPEFEIMGNTHEHPELLK